MVGYDNNTPYDCTYAGVKQGCQAHSAGVQPLRDCQTKTKEILDDDVIAVYLTSLMLGEYQNDCLS